MSDPESAQLVKVSEVSLEHVNKKLRLYGRVYSYDVDTSLIVLCDPDTSLRKGVWVDATLCLNPKYSAPWKREPMHMVIVVGYLEACEPPLHELDQGGALLGHLKIDNRWRLQAIVLESCDGLNVEALDETCRRMASRGPYPTLSTQPSKLPPALETAYSTDRDKA